MTRLNWNAVGERFYEAGVDRGVLYIDGAPGVPWNGLISVSESPKGGEAKPIYLDGIKSSNRSGSEEFEATVEAYTYPDEFEQCDGTKAVKNGLFATQQKRKTFGLAYRNHVGNDIQGISHGYKIHIIYEALAAPAPVTHTTTSDADSPFNFSWTLTTRPPFHRGYRPTSHFIIDTRDAPLGAVQELEAILYGDVDGEPRLPSVGELVYLFDNYGTGIFDARTVGQDYYNTFDGGNPPTELQTSTIDGGAP